MTLAKAKDVRISSYRNRLKEETLQTLIKYIYSACNKGEHFCIIPYDLIGDSEVNNVFLYLKELDYTVKQVHKPIKPDWYEITDIEIRW